MTTEIIQTHYPNGKLYTESNLLISADGTNLLHGEERSYHQNGKLRVKTIWYKGLKNGYDMLYDNKGGLIEYRYYRMGKPIGYDFYRPWNIFRFKLI